MRFCEEFIGISLWRLLQLTTLPVKKNHRSFV